MTQHFTQYENNSYKANVLIRDTVNSFKMLKMLLYQKMRHILLIGSLCFIDNLILELSPSNYNIEEGMAHLAPFPIFMHLYNTTGCTDVVRNFVA